MNFVTTILFLGAAFFVALVSCEDSKHPLLDAKGMVGLRNCGTKNDLIKITSITHSMCEKSPCELSLKDFVTLKVEFVPLENIASLSTCIDAVANGLSVPILSEDTCKGLVVGKCPFVKGETYVQSIVVDIDKKTPSSIKTAVGTASKLKVDTEISISNPDKTLSACATWATNVV